MTSLGLLLTLLIPPMGGAQAQPSDRLAETARAMRVGHYLVDLRACAWSRVPAFEPYVALSVDDLDDGVERLLSEEEARDAGIRRVVRQGFLFASRKKFQRTEAQCAEIAETIRADLGVDPRVP